MCTSQPKPPKPIAPPPPTPVETHEAATATSKEDTLSRKKNAKRKGKKALRVDRAGLGTTATQSGLAIKR